jgi:hypothetical protein
MIKGYNTARVERNNPTLELPQVPIQVWMIQRTTACADTQTHLISLRLTSFSDLQRRHGRSIASCQVYREPLEVGQRTGSQGTLMGGTQNAETQSKRLQAASRSLGLQLQVLHASTGAELEAGALLICADPLFVSRSAELAALAPRHAVPAIWQGSEFVAAGGLASYGTSIAYIYRIACHRKQR